MRENTRFLWLPKQITADIGGLKTTQTFSFTVLEAGSSKSRGWQGGRAVLPLKPLRDDPSLTLPASGGCQAILVVLGV